MKLVEKHWSKTMATSALRYRSEIQNAIKKDNSRIQATEINFLEGLDNALEKTTYEMNALNQS